MTKVISVSPFRCCMWNGHARLIYHINEHSCRAEIASVSKHGQLLPVLGRPVAKRNGQDIELIFGARRLFIAQYLNIPLLVEMRDISDREAIIALENENHLRKELSPYERGRSFSAWLRDGLFNSQEELAQVLNISASQVSRLLKLAQLPEVIVGAFSTPTQICENWGRDLMKAWSHVGNRDAMTATAKIVAKESPLRPAAVVYQRLIAAKNSERSRRRTEASSHDEVIKDAVGNPLFRVSARTKEIALLLPIEHLSASSMREIKGYITTVLQRARTQDLELSGNKDGQKRMRGRLMPIRPEVTQVVSQPA